MPITSRLYAGSQILSRSYFKSTDLRMLWLRAAQWSVAMAKRAYPIILVFAILVTIFAATIALRLAIWLPSFRY